MIPTFGNKLDNVDYQARYGVYGIVARHNNTEICLVQAPNGAYFLPGGEIELGEDHKKALHRELHEELGAKAKLGKFLGQADEFFYSSHRDTYYHNPAYIYETIGYEILGAPLEDFNHIDWFPVDQAISKLKRGSHKWGVTTWQDYLNSL